MRKSRQPRISKQQTYSKRRLAGLDAHCTVQKRVTVDRLTAAIKSLKVKRLPISIKTIREECGLEYNTIKRNPEAHLLYQQHSTFLRSKRQQMKLPRPTAPMPRDPLQAYKKSQLVIRVREEMQLRQEMEAQHLEVLREEKRLRQEVEEPYIKLLENFVQKDITIAKLEARIAEYEDYLGRLRIQIQQEEHKEL